MGIRGLVQTKQPEYGGDWGLSCWVADQAKELLRQNGVDVWEPEYGDSWEICVSDKLREVVDKLRDNPQWFDEYLTDDLKGNGYGESLLGVLQDGLDAATANDYTTINIDWF